MILTVRQWNYFAKMPSRAAHSLARGNNTKVPFFVDDPIIIHYELLRAVWAGEYSMRQAQQKFNVGHSYFYTIEKNFIEYGIIGLFPRIGNKTHPDRIERLVLLVKKVRPEVNQTTIYRLLEALGLAEEFSLKELSLLLKCHGYRNGYDHGDREFWKNLQDILKTFEVRRQHPGPERKRGEDFFLKQDTLQVQFELFRELALSEKPHIEATVNKYGFSRTHFYKYYHRFFQYGPWGLIENIRPGKGKQRLSLEMELAIIEEKLQYPKLTLEQIRARFQLKCARSIIHDTIHYWGLQDKNRAPHSLRGLIRPLEAPPRTEEKPKLVQPARQILRDDGIRLDLKVNRHFGKLIQRMKKRSFSICDPGPIILAQFVDDFGIAEALHLYGPEKFRGGEMTNIIMLNIFRILAGYETINCLKDNSDRSVAIAAGLGMFPGKTTRYNDLMLFKFVHLEKLRNDAAAHARELGLISGTHIAFDFNFKEFYGAYAAEKKITKGPNKNGDLCPGFRPHIVWDLENDVLLNIAFCHGATRAPTIIREFCIKNLFNIIDRDVIEEIYMDSEYTSFPNMTFFIPDSASETNITMCLKQNKRIKLMMQEAISKNSWEPFDNEHEILGHHFQLPNLNKQLHLVVKRKIKTGETRCFGTTITGLSHREVLLHYRFRWPIENGMKDLIYSYFIHKILGNDPEKIEANFYCVMVARLVFEHFLRALGGYALNDEDGYKRTLQQFRYLIFSKRNCKIQCDEDSLILTFLDVEDSQLEADIRRVLNDRNDKGLNRVSWWGGLGLKVKFENQYAEN